MNVSYTPVPVLLGVLGSKETSPAAVVPAPNICSEIIYKFPKPPHQAQEDEPVLVPADDLQDEYKSESVSQNCCHRYLGIIYAFFQCIVFSISSLIVKAIPQYHPYSVAFWSFAVNFICSLSILIYYQYFKNKRVIDEIWPLAGSAEKRKELIGVLLRGLLGTQGSVLMISALQYIDVADSTVIVFSSPIVVALLAFFFLGEKCGIVPIFSASLAMVGVIVIARPPFLTGSATFNRNHLIGTLLATAAMLFIATIVVLLRYLRKVNFSVIITAFGLIGSIECAILCGVTSRFDIPTTAWDWVLMLGIGFTAFLGQILITSALKYESASVVSIIRTCTIIFSFIWQFIFLNVQPDTFSGIGAAVVVFGVLLVATRKWVNELPEASVAKRRLWILLK